MKSVNILTSLLIFTLLFSCRKDNLPDNIFDSVYEEESGIEIFTIEKFYFSNDHKILYVYFLNDSVMLHARDVADSLVVFRDGKLHQQDTPKDHFADFNIFPNDIYTYTFAFRDSMGALTKISTPHIIEIP